MSDLTKRVGTFKLVFLGESAVGKSSIIQRFTRNIFDPYREATIGAAFISRVFDFPDYDRKILNRIKYEIWDTAGQERYKSLTPMYYRNAHVAIIVFDLTDKNSFEKAKDWVGELQGYADEARTESGGSGHLVTILVGNKLDLLTKGRERATPIGEVDKFIRKRNYLYIETSAKTGENVKELFETSIAKHLPDQLFTVEGEPSVKPATGSYTVDLNEGILRPALSGDGCAC